MLYAFIDRNSFHDAFIQNINVLFCFILFIIAYFVFFPVFKHIFDGFRYKTPKTKQKKNSNFIIY